MTVYLFVHINAHVIQLPASDTRNIYLLARRMLSKLELQWNPFITETIGFSLNVTNLSVAH